MTPFPQQGGLRRFRRIRRFYLFLCMTPFPQQGGLRRINAKKIAYFFSMTPFPQQGGLRRSAFSLFILGIFMYDSIPIARRIATLFTPWETR